MASYKILRRKWETKDKIWIWALLRLQVSTNSPVSYIFFYKNLDFTKLFYSKLTYKTGGQVFRFGVYWIYSIAVKRLNLYNWVDLIHCWQKNLIKLFQSKWECIVKRWDFHKTEHLVIFCQPTNPILVNFSTWKLYI